MVEKTCSACGKTKSILAFARDRGYRDGLHGKCRICSRAYRESIKDPEKQREYQRRHREKFPERRLLSSKKYREANPDRVLESNRASKKKHAEKVRKYDKTRRAEFKEWISGLKLAAGCIDCGYNKRAVALDYDHLDPTTKKFNVSQGFNYSREDVLAEIAKCELVCACCHRVREEDRREVAKVTT